MSGDGGAGFCDEAAVVAEHEVDDGDLAGDESAGGGDGGGGDAIDGLHGDEAGGGVEALGGVVCGAHRVLGGLSVVAGAGLEIDLDQAELGVGGEQARGDDAAAGVDQSGAGGQATAGLGAADHGEDAAVHGDHRVLDDRAVAEVQLAADQVDRADAGRRRCDGGGAGRGRSCLCGHARKAR